MPITLTFNKTQTTEQREAITGQIISCYENLDVSGLFEILQNRENFDYEDFTMKGLANVRDKFNAVIAKGIRTLESCNTICTGCDYGHVVKAFYSGRHYLFAIRFVEENGVKDQFVFCAEFLKLNMTNEEIQKKQRDSNFGAGPDNLMEGVKRLKENKQIELGF